MRKGKQTQPDRGWRVLQRRQPIVVDLCERRQFAVTQSRRRRFGKSFEDIHGELLTGVEPKEDAVSYATSIQRFAPRDAFRAERPVAGLHIIFDFALFTPFEVSRMIAKMMLSGAAAEIERKGFITLMEPAAGAGGMVIAAASALLDEGINYQQTMHATLIDVDPIACHMAYVQMSLLHVPAIVIHGNALAPNATWGHWVTPAHVIGLWDIKLRRRDSNQAEREAATADGGPAVAAAPEPGAAQRAEIVARRIEQFDLFS
ncbi:SAM-dependent methyltransferase [Ralstonia solanacearum]|uniref:SAM-dependent methyltransferase n=1 Tax=Ralstonia solanacearum TaxID=305 RepID=UPI001E39CE82|nr:SAM-dependent methyltransferase [Ralstonia solanacearum]